MSKWEVWGNNHMPMIRDWSEIGGKSLRAEQSLCLERAGCLYLSWDLWSLLCKVPTRCFTVNSHSWVCTYSRRLCLWDCGCSPNHCSLFIWKLEEYDTLACCYHLAWNFYSSLNSCLPPSVLAPLGRCPSWRHSDLFWDTQLSVTFHSSSPLFLWLPMASRVKMKPLNSG